MLKRVLILGNSGFIGQALENAIRVAWPNLELVGKSIEELNLTDAKDVRSLEPFLDMSTSILFCSAIKREHGDTFENFSHNCAMVGNLCALLEKTPVRQLIFFSSAAVYGEDVHNTSISEQTPLSPTSFYGIAKATGEYLLRKTFSKLHESALVLLRPPTIYGPTETRKSYGPYGFLNAVSSGQKITLWGDGEELREFVYIDDVTRVVLGLLDSNYSGLLNLACGESTTFTQILSFIEDELKQKPDLESRPRSKAKVDNAFDNDRFQSLFPDFKFTPLREGIRKIAQAMGK